MTANQIAYQNLKQTERLNDARVADYNSQIAQRDALLNYQKAESVSKTFKNTLGGIGDFVGGFFL